MKRTNLESILKGLDIVREALVSELNSDAVETVATEVVTNVIDINEKIKATVGTEDKSVDVIEEDATEEPPVEADKNTEYLNSLTLKELKELAKELKVSTKGTKGAIVGRIMEAQEELEVEPVEEVVEADIVEDEDLNPSEDDVVVNSLEEQIQAMEVEELADILSSVGISTKGKKQSLVAKVLKAVEEGVIKFADEDEEDAEEVVEEQVSDETVEDEEGIDLQEILDELGTKELKDLAKALGIKVALKDKKASLIEKIMLVEDEELLMNALVEKGIIEADEEVEESEVEESDEFEVEGSDARVEAVENKFAEVMEQIDNEEITVDEIKEFFEEYWADNKSELKKVSAMNDEDLASNYSWIQANLIDDEAEEVDFNEPFMVGDKPFCCGRPMKKLNDTTFVCEIDGEEVEIEE